MMIPGMGMPKVLSLRCSDSSDTISDRKESVIYSEPNKDDDKHLGYEYIVCYILR